MSEDLQNLLKKYENMVQKGWKDVFLNYLRNLKNIQKLDSCIKEINSDRDSFFGVYTSVSEYEKDKYDIRYKGQKIARLQNGNVVSVESNVDRLFFSFPKNIIGEPLSRSIKLLYNITEKKEIRSKEHLFESRLLKYLNSPGKKILRQVAPVTINNLFFQMPTFFKASDHGKEKFSLSGGGIDIFARIKCRSASPRYENCFCIMELKDSITKGTEEPMQIIRQAMAYACCVQQLIRSEYGQEWYDFFRAQDDSKEIPSSLVLYACVVVLFGGSFQKENIPESYKIKEELSFTNGDKLRLRYLYLGMNKKYTEIIDDPVTNLELKIL